MTKTRHTCLRRWEIEVKVKKLLLIGVVQLVYPGIHNHVYKHGEKVIRSGCRAPPRGPACKLTRVGKLLEKKGAASDNALHFI